MKKTQGSRPLDDPTFDWTARVGPRFPLAASNDIPVYNYEQPAWLFWNGLAGGLHAAGWTDGEVKDWLRGETARRFLDTFGERVHQLGRDLSAEALKGAVFTVAKAELTAEPPVDLSAKPPPFFRPAVAAILDFCAGEYPATEVTLQAAVDALWAICQTGRPPRAGLSEAEEGR